MFTALLNTHCHWNSPHQKKLDLISCQYGLQRFMQYNQCSHKQVTFTVQEELSITDLNLSDETMRAVAELTSDSMNCKVFGVKYVLDMILTGFEVHPSIYFLLQLVLVYRCSLILGTLHLFHVSICLALDLHLLA